LIDHRDSFWKTAF